MEERVRERRPFLCNSFNSTAGRQFRACRTCWLTGESNLEKVHIIRCMKMTSLFRAFSLASLLCAPFLQIAAQEADAKLESFFKTYMDDYFRLRPLEARRLGDHRLASHL